MAGLQCDMRFGDLVVAMETAGLQCDIEAFAGATAWTEVSPEGGA